MREAWGYARQCTGTQKGGRRLWGRYPIISIPSLTQSIDVLQAHSNKGGWAAEVVSGCDENDDDDKIERTLEAVDQHVESIFNDVQR